MSLFQMGYLSESNWILGCKVRARIENGLLTGRDEIGVRVGKAVNEYKVGKHFALCIEESRFEFHRPEKQIVAKAAMVRNYPVLGINGSGASRGIL